MASDCGPLLLAIHAMNAKAVKDLLENDSSINLREALRGPVDLQDPDTSLWNYEFLRGDLTLPF